MAATKVNAATQITGILPRASVPLIVSTAAVGSEPGSPSTGDVCIPTNGFTLERYSGTAWVPWGPVFPLTDPTTPAWSWVNQGSASVVTTNGGVYLGTSAANASVLSINARVKSAPATPYTATFAWLPQSTWAASALAGVLFRESATGKMLFYSLINSTAGGTAGSAAIIIYRMTSPTVASSTPFAATFAVSLDSLKWFRLKHDGTSLFFYVSSDGQNWTQFYTEAKAAFFTTGPDQIGFGINPFSQICGMTLLSYLEG